MAFYFYRTSLYHVHLQFFALQIQPHLHTLCQFIINTHCYACTCLILPLFSSLCSFISSLLFPSADHLCTSLLLDVCNNNWSGTQYVPGALPHFSSGIIILCAFSSPTPSVTTYTGLSKFRLPKAFFNKNTVPFFLFLSLASFCCLLPSSSPCALFIVLLTLF